MHWTVLHFVFYELPREAGLEQVRNERLYQYVNPFMRSIATQWDEELRGVLKRVEEDASEKEPPSSESRVIRRRKKDSGLQRRLTRISAAGIRSL